MELLRVENLKTHFFTANGVVPAVDDVSFSIPQFGRVGIVGESGCGKSMTALSLLRLISSPGKIISGKILFDRKDLLQISESEMRSIRGKKIAMIFQDPMTSLNPVFTIGNQISEAIELHQNLSRKAAWPLVIESLQLVKIPDPERVAKSYPHELSGGMRQRVMIAMALSCKPDLLIADEPTTALDVTIQAQVLNLLLEIQQKTKMAILLITHDLGVVAETMERVIVMYAGKIVEEGPVRDLFLAPRHPYTQALLKSLPTLHTTGRLKTIQGQVPDLTRLPKGCAYQDRCELKKTQENAQCENVPEFHWNAQGHGVRCFYV